MQFIKTVIFLILSAFVFTSCDDKLEINADWKDITVVYGLLDQGDSVHYIKITKAFLGPENAYTYAKIPDSSNYREKLEVTLEGLQVSKYDTIVKQTFSFDTTMISNEGLAKESGDFYFPDQLVYKNKTNIKLNQDYVYRIIIRNTATNKLITAQTHLVHKMSISKPFTGVTASFLPDKMQEAIWTTAEGGKRYQLVSRFYYLEKKKADPSQEELKYVNWQIFDLKSDNTIGGKEMTYSYPSNSFYAVVGSNIPVDPGVNRYAIKMEYEFIVAAEALNTYMEVSEPSNTVVQEKPPFTNIVNGIGIFSSRYNSASDYPIIQMPFNAGTIEELRVNPNTYLLGF